MATMYVTEQGARIEKEYRRVLVTKHDEVLLRVPLARLSHVVLVGRVGATTPAMLALLDAGIGLSLIGRDGRLRGRLLPPTGKNIPLRQAQYARAQDPAFCLDIARAVVLAKLKNCHAVYRRIARAHPESMPETVRLLPKSIHEAGRAEDVAALRGYEGLGSRAYFAALRQGLQHRLGFERRNRRPPRDPINAMLSLGYSLLTANLMTACEVVGLDPYDGYFHADKYGRPALALDLMEPFRSVIVDSVVLNLVNREMIKLKDFFWRGEAVLLSPKGLRTFFEQYTERLQVRVKHPKSGRRLTYQQWFEVQARSLAKAIQGRDAFLPFRTR